MSYLALTTLLGARLAGKQATIRDFFLGGRKLPWPAVAGSIIATEISAVTFLAVPAIVFAQGGNFTYLQLGIGAVLARVIIGVWFVPAFYEREIYSPYEYMGQRLGTPVRTVTTGLFMLGAVLGQSVRVLLTAMVLQLMTGFPLGVSIWVIGAIAVAWTLLGGITTVIWTDVVQFGVFLIGLTAALVYVCVELPGGAREMIRVAAEADKFRFWNFSTDPNVAFTIWAALIANTFLCLNAYGTDQLIAQRMFCCRGKREARIAIITSSVGQLVAGLALFVGVGLYAYYHRFGLTGEAARLVADKGDRIFPVFILQKMPPGLVGLIIAGVFAAAISSLDSVLAALSQTVVSGFYKPWRERRRESEPEAQARVEAADGAREQGTEGPSDLGVEGHGTKERRDIGTEEPRDQGTKGKSGTMSSCRGCWWWAGASHYAPWHRSPNWRWRTTVTYSTWHWRWPPIPAGLCWRRSAWRCSG